MEHLLTRQSPFYSSRVSNWPVEPHHWSPSHNLVDLYLSWPIFSFLMQQTRKDILRFHQYFSWPTCSYWVQEQLSNGWRIRDDDVRHAPISVSSLAGWIFHGGNRWGPLLWTWSLTWACRVASTSLLDFETGIKYGGRVRAAIWWRSRRRRRQTATRTTFEFGRYISSAGPGYCRQDSGTGTGIRRRSATTSLSLDASTSNRHLWPAAVRYGSWNGRNRGGRRRKNNLWITIIEHVRCNRNRARVNNSSVCTFQSHTTIHTSPILCHPSYQRWSHNYTGRDIWSRETVRPCSKEEGSYHVETKRHFGGGTGATLVETSTSVFTAVGSQSW